MIVIGIVGSPAGGKSTVARHLQDLGAAWINADEVARGVLERDDVQAELLRHFGSHLAGKDGRIDRMKLAAEVFGDDDAKRVALTYLEGLIHPRTRQIIRSRLWDAQKSGTKVVVLDVPLMFKSGWDKSCDEIWCVDADRSIRLQRAAKRGWSDQQLRDRELNQLDIEDKKKLSTHLINNDGTIHELHQTVERLLQELIERHPERISDNHCQHPEGKHE